MNGNHMIEEIDESEQLRQMCSEWKQHVADCIEIAKRGQATAGMWEVIEIAAGVANIEFSGSLPIVPTNPELIDDTPF